MTIRALLDSTTWRPIGSEEFILDHVTSGVGLPSAVHFKMAVWLSLTVVSTGRCSRVGAEMDWPGSPFVPFSPGGPRGPTGPGSPESPWSPFIPNGPCGPTGPCLPGGPSGPGLPGGPGLPRIPGLPRRPVLPFDPERQSVSSLAQIWFCNSSKFFFNQYFYIGGCLCRFLLWFNRRCTLLSWVDDFGPLKNSHKNQNKGNKWKRKNVELPTKDCFLSMKYFWLYFIVT